MNSFWKNFIKPEKYSCTPRGKQNSKVAAPGLDWLSHVASSTHIMGASGWRARVITNRPTLAPQFMCVSPSMDISMQPREKESRGSGIIIILILLLGFICIIVASGWALRFAPSWRLNTNMESNLNPNSDFLTHRPVSFIEPLDPSILTQPAWINLFLTPGISLATRTPLPTSTVTNIPSKTSTPIVIPTQTTVPTNTLAVIVVI